MTYKVTFERDTDSGWWLARVPSVPGCHTQGRTVGEARRRIREALSLFVDDAAVAEFQETVTMPMTVKRAVRAYRLLRKRADAEAAKASRAATFAVKSLQHSTLRLSTRDAAAILGISHQRVAQLAAQKRRRG